MGHEGAVAGTREWGVRKLPYVIVYRDRGTDIEILHVYHGAQDRPHS